MNSLNLSIVEHAVSFIKDVLAINDEQILLVNQFTDRRRYPNYWIYRIDIVPAKCILIKTECRDQHQKEFVECVIKTIEQLDRLFNSIEVSYEMHGEIKELVKRLSIPMYLAKMYNYRAQGLSRSISEETNIDYGRLIRELIKWSNATIEGKKITTGILIADSRTSVTKVLGDSIEFILLEEELNLFDFSKVKSLLEIVDGQNSYLAVKPNNDGLVAFGLIFSRKPILTDFNFENSKGFIAPVFSVNSLGIRVGRGRQLILEFINGSPKMRDYKGFAEHLEKSLNRVSKDKKLLTVNNLVTKTDARNLTRLLLELSRYGKGASLVFGFEKDEELVATVEQPNWIEDTALPLGWGNGRKIKDQIGMEILSSISKTDGAVLIGKDFKIIAFGAILRASGKNAKVSGGSRHKSMASYTANKREILGIVISSDGPISLIESNKCICHL
ncbi:diadenylate cyclase [Bacillus thuringiensis]|uniref:diadenylate cyclase n=1 Tax=Bacillus thuringiensis TaxID=1428 RepID=UPI000BF7F38F|nr:diadenylate cyclase [Bacillus thuringiensis]PEQ30015.1 hypothetical protein CN471_24800 [Bacillus thuringiensis]